MNVSRFLCSALFVLLGIASGVLAQDVKTDYDHHA